VDLQSLTDEELAALAAANSGAMDILLFRHKNTVKMLSRPYFIIGADHEDLVQEGMIGLYKAIRDYTPAAASFATFAAACIKNQMLTAIKNAARKKHSPLNTYISIDQENPEIFHITDQEYNPEHALDIRENRRKITALAATSLSHLEAACLADFLKGLSYNEIAEKQGITAKSVDNALHRIRRKLAENKT